MAWINVNSLINISMVNPNQANHEPATLSGKQCSSYCWNQRVHKAKIDAVNIDSFAVKYKACIH